MSHRITQSDLLRALDSPAAVSACVALPSRLESVRQTRRFVSDQLGRWGCESLTDCTVRICSELAANAVTHAEPDAAGRGEILVSLTFVAGETLIAQVADSDPSSPVPKITRPQGLAESGRGLSIVTKLSDYWSASPRSDGQGKTVSAYLRDHQQALALGAPSAADRALPPPAGPDRVPSEDAAGLVTAAEPGGAELPQLDFSKPAVARVCDSVTGGTDNYPADRALGRQLLEVAPWLDRASAAARAHGQHVVRHLASQGTVQFLDLGCGLPRRRNVHDAAQEVQREASVVYVDRDPMVQAHVRTVFEETPREMGLHADITLTEAMLAQPAIARLDRGKPMAVLLHEVLPWIDDDKARHLLDTLRSWLPDGSVLSVVHAAADSHPESTPDLVALYHEAGILYRPRTLEQLLALTADWDVDGPGIAAVPLDGRRAVGSREPLYGSYAFTACASESAGRRLGPDALAHTLVAAGCAYREASR
ncbi:hypothetical protein Slala04_01170 [Streptomyces lavendulae subsp. lavendulae]|nr:hypothetical protein Slala04_01170 [Streptomyces lavendulae subsp. lavendulae]